MDGEDQDIELRIVVLRADRTESVDVINLRAFESQVGAGEV